MANKKSLKKIAQILILATLISTIFVACDEADDDTQTTTTDFDSDTATLQNEEETDRLLPDLPDYDWDGYNFRILTIGGSSDSEWSIRIPRDIAADEETGSPLNDAVYYRNRNLEEKYNFTIEQVFIASDAFYPLRTAVMAGDEYFDVISESLGPGSGSSAREGLLVDLFTVDYLNFEKPWWDQGIVRDTAISNKLFYISGDLTLINRDSTATILFNKELIEALQLEDPYELVRSNQWTLAKLYEMSSVAGVDLNGDGKMDSDTDRFGFVSSLAGGGLATGAGVRYTEIDTNGVPILIFASERNFDAVYTCWSIMNADFTSAASGGYIGTDPIISEPESIFTAGRGLFFQAMIRTVENLRESETDFGILPMPKYDENQKEWGHNVNSLFGQLLAIPNFGNDEALTRTGFILEAIAAESTYTTVPAWYDVQLTTKFARDAESKEMLDIIFSSIVWDPYTIYNWGDSFNIWGSAKTGTLASDWASNLRKIEIEMNATIKAFEKLD